MELQDVVIENGHMIDFQAITLSKQEVSELAHALWSHWMRHLICTRGEMDLAANELRLPGEDVDRWARQMNTPYAVLTKSEQLSDFHAVMECLGKNV